VRQIATPALVEQMGLEAFWWCPILNDVIFPGECSLVAIEVFSQCGALERMEISPPVQMVVGFTICSVLS
jgi:hypothetical protein